MTKISHNQQVRGLQVINHLSLIAGLCYVAYTGTYHYLLTSLVTYWVIGILGINVGYHRLLSHRSFKTNKFWETILSIIGVLTTVGSPLAWVAIHRQHHRTAERPGDPHSPYILGNWRAWFGLWDIVKLDVKLIRDMRESAFQRWLHKNYLSIILIYCAVLINIDPMYIIFVYAIPACLCLHSTSAIIVIAHRHGYRPYPDVKDQSRNSWIANLITLGEGWHNTHHAKPYAWNNQERWWEFDIPAYIIRLIKK
jgi:stearoyl-CoA desaturase (delta-9 desaturase)